MYHVQLKKLLFQPNKIVIFSATLLIVMLLPLIVLLSQKEQTIQQHAAGSVPSFQHIFFIIEENHDYNQIIGSTAAPYINSLVAKGGLATNYHAAAHPSLPNYFALTAGATIVTSDTSGPQAAANIASALTGGKTWKAYMESMPGPCTKSDSGGYVQHHNPFSYFSDLSTTCGTNDVPYTQFAADLSGGKVGTLTWIVPNVQDDMHSGTIQQGDTWLSQEVPKILASSAYQQNGLLIITTDEGLKGAGTNQVFTIFLSSSVTPGFTSAVSYTHYSLLRTIADGLGVTAPGQAASAPPMSDFFGAGIVHTQLSPTPSQGVQPTQPLQATPLPNPCDQNVLAAAVVKRKPTPTKKPTPTLGGRQSPTPTHNPQSSPTSSPNATISPCPSNGTPAPTQPGGATDTPAPTDAQGMTPEPSGNPNGDTLLSLSIGLPGIGKGGNVHPIHPLRKILVTVYNVVTQAAVTKEDTFVFNGDSFINPAVDVGQLPTGQYQIFVKSNGYLQLRLNQTDGTNTFNIATGSTLMLPTNMMLAGDIAPINPKDPNTYGDNIVDLLDYNLLINCYGTKATTNSCPNKSIADLDDNNFVDGIDYNIFLRTISQTANGDIIPGQESNPSTSNARISPTQ